ncbi:hypothetical protein AVEN_125689-1 [Araneus ventricosus]|uniref:Secreted protein n=1 Tax=Araneus ventricosus TaxID=182803 RepID=A0A4Y2F953_ARAVE|nr:hypothetical protein AVEN_125689-1 [Araneus ventricosus]
MSCSTSLLDAVFHVLFNVVARCRVPCLVQRRCSMPCSMSCSTSLLDAVFHVLFNVVARCRIPSLVQCRRSFPLPSLVLRSLILSCKWR